MVSPYDRKLSLQDILIATAFAGAATAAVSAGLTCSVPAPLLSPRPVILWFVALPGSAGAAVGCLVFGWRRCWALALAAIIAALMVWLAMVGLFAFLDAWISRA